MFCGNCGTQNPDHAVFCKICGFQLKPQAGAYSATKLPARNQHRRPGVKQKRRKNSPVKLAIIVLLAIVLLGAALLIFGGRSYKATVKQFFNAQFEVDAKKILKLLPDGVIEYTIREEDFDDLDEMIDEMNDSIQDQIDYIERYLGSDWSASYQIASVENMPKDELESLKRTYKKLGVKVSAAKTVELELTVKAGETESSNSMDLSLIKVGNSWYIDIDSMGSLF